MRLHAFVIHLPRSFDSITKTGVKIARFAAFVHFLLVVKLDLRNQKPCETAGIVVKPAFVFRNFDWQIDVSITEPASTGQGQADFAASLNRAIRSRYMGR